MRDSILSQRRTTRTGHFVIVTWMQFGCLLAGCNSNEGSVVSAGGNQNVAGGTLNTTSSVLGTGGSSGYSTSLSTLASGGISSASGGGSPTAAGGVVSNNGGVNSGTSKVDATGGVTTSIGGTPSTAGRTSTNNGGTAGRTNSTSSVGGKAATGGTTVTAQAGSSSASLSGGTSSSSAASVCLDFPAPTSVGTIESAALNGPSGMVASRSNPGVLYAHLDTGGTATVYAMTTTGKSLGEYAVTGATNTDWEDIAVGPGPGAGSYIYIGDIGDNAARTGGTVRKEIQVYRVPEPKVTTTQAAATQSLAGAEVLRFTYPDAAHDAETLIVDPVSGDIVIITKETDGNSSIYRAPGNTPLNTPTVLEKLGNVKIGASGQAAMASGGDASPTGDRFMVRSYTALLIFTRASNLTTTFAGTPKSIAFAPEPQGEGVTFSADGKAIFTTGEQAKVIYQSQSTCP